MAIFNSKLLNYQSVTWINHGLLLGWPWFTTSQVDQVTAFQRSKGQIARCEGFRHAQRHALRSAVAVPRAETQQETNATGTRAGHDWKSTKHRWLYNLYGFIVIYHGFIMYWFIVIYSDLSWFIMDIHPNGCIYHGFIMNSPSKYPQDVVF